MFGLYGSLGERSPVFVPERCKPAGADAEAHRFVERPFAIGRKPWIESSVHHRDGLIAAVTGHCVDRDGEAIEAEHVARQYCAEGKFDISTARGHFVVAIADGARGRLIVARDRMAIAPLYVCRLSDGLLFSSEYKDFLPHLGSKKRLDYPVIERFLRDGWMPAARTFFRDITPVAPGVLNVFDCNGRLHVEEGTILEAEPKVEFGIEELEAALDRAVRRHLGPGTQRYGLMLSGGVDSALVGHLLKRALVGSHVWSYTVGYGKDDPEVEGARRTAATLGLAHTELFVDLEELTELLPASILATENIGGFDEYPCLYAMHKKAEGQVDVMFSGNFSDALFGGMRMHRDVWTACREGKRIEHPGRNRPTEGSPLRAGVSGEEREPIEDAPPPQSLSEVLTRFVLDRDERMSMQASFAQEFGMHARMPYTDLDVVSLALKLPDHLKLDQRRNKIILRGLASRYLPQEIWERPKAIQQLKYDRDMQHWLRWQIEKLTESYAFEEILSPDYIWHVSRIANESAEGEAIHAAWNVVAFAHWCECFI